MGNREPMSFSEISETLRKPISAGFDEKQWWNANSGRPTRNKKCTEKELIYYRSISFKQMKEIGK